MIEIASIVVTVLLFLGVLFVLVLVHEWGHFIVAKLTGMRVDEFGIGFPPKLYSIKKGETEYSFNALPIGGFVRILGEDPTQVHEDSERAFSSKNRFAQALVLIAGVTMNVLFAWFLYVIIFMSGATTAVDEEVASDDARLIVAYTLPDSPAAVLPFRAEISSFSVDGVVRSDLLPSEVSEYIAAAGTNPVTITYVHGEDTVTEVITPTVGVVDEDPERTAIGASFVLVEEISYPFFQSLIRASETTVTNLRDITIGLYTLIVGAITGTADLSQVAGPVGIIDLVGDAAKFGLIPLLMFTAVISLNLAIINLLPIPALDGGRLLFVAIEAVTRREINPVWVSRVNTVGFSLLMLLMIVITVSDVTRLL